MVFPKLAPGTRDAAEMMTESHALDLCTNLPFDTRIIKLGRVVLHALSKTTRALMDAHASGAEVRPVKKKRSEGVGGEEVVYFVNNKPVWPRALGLVLKRANS